MTEHGHIFDQMRNESINVALNYYNLGELAGKRETCFVYGFLRWDFGLAVKVTLTRGRRASDEIEFLRSDIDFEWESNDTALIELPVIYVPLFGLSPFVLDDDGVRRHQRYVEHFNSPKLSPTLVRPVERVAGIRI